MSGFLVINLQCLLLFSKQITPSCVNNLKHDYFSQNVEKLTTSHISVYPRQSEVITSEVHIYVTQSQIAATPNWIYACPTKPNFIINLHIGSLNIASQGRVIEINTGILHMYFHRQNDLINLDTQDALSNTSFAKAGIECSDNAQLIIEAENSSDDNILKVVGSRFSPGIGTSIGLSPGDNCDLIHIKSGKIISSSLYHGAAIGSGIGQSENSSNVHQILIEGGTIDARADPFGNGCGIGTGGPVNAFSSNVGSIIITGGQIISNGGTHISGIGTTVKPSKTLLPNSGNVKEIIFKGGDFMSDLNNLNVIHASAIGTGYGATEAYSQGSNIGTINFTHSSIFTRHFTGSEGHHSAIIGSGFGISYNSSNIKEINIISGEMEIINQNSITGDNDGVALGGGYGKADFSSNVGIITIGKEKTQLLKLNITSSSKSNPAIGSYKSPNAGSGIVGSLEIGEFIHYLIIRSEFRAIEEKSTVKIGINLTFLNEKKNVNYSNPYISSSKFSHRQISLSNLFNFYIFAFQGYAVI